MVAVGRKIDVAEVLIMRDFRQTCKQKGEWW